VRHPGRAIGTWLLLVVAAVALGAGISMHTTTDADYRVGQSGVASKQIEQAGLDAPDTEYIVLSRAAGGPADSAVHTAAQQLAATVRTDAHVQQVAEHVVHQGHERGRRVG